MICKAPHVLGLRAVSLALLPMVLGLAGAVFDERMRLGFSTWRAACREAGPTAASLLTFTLQLMPTAVAGVLAGGCLVLILGVLQRQPRSGATALAAHGGCVVGMAAGLPLCILTLPLPLVLGVETLLTAAGAWFFYTLLQRSRTGQVRNRAYIGVRLHIRESET